MKPVASGGQWLQGRWTNEDVAALEHYSTPWSREHQAPPMEWVNPYGFDPPIAPHIAAQQEGREISFAVIRSCLAQLQAGTRAVVVEGAGGLRVPLGTEGDMIDLCVALDLPLILVVGLRLGCLNQALLSMEAIQRRGARWGGWVANELTPNLVVRDEQIDTLRARMENPYLGMIPFGAEMDTGAQALDWVQLLGQNRTGVE